MLEEFSNDTTLDSMRRLYRSAKFDRTKKHLSI